MKGIKIFNHTITIERDETPAEEYVTLEDLLVAVQPQLLCACLAMLVIFTVWKFTIA